MRALFCPSSCSQLSRGCLFLFFLAQQAFLHFCQYWLVVEVPKCCCSPACPLARLSPAILEYTTVSHQHLTSDGPKSFMRDAGDGSGVTVAERLYYSVLSCYLISRKMQEAGASSAVHHGRNPLCKLLFHPPLSIACAVLCCAVSDFAVGRQKKKKKRLCCLSNHVDHVFGCVKQIKGAA